MLSDTGMLEAMCEVIYLALKTGFRVMGAYAENL